MPSLTGPEWGPATKGKPKQLVVICHGLGADGQDMIGLAPRYGLALPDALFVAPDAPEPYDHAAEGRQWFPIAGIDPAKFSAGVRRAAVALDQFIDEQLAKHDLTDYAVTGFSQGAMTALFTGLRRVPAPKAIVALSGALIDPEALNTELKNRAPVFLGHGAKDETVPAFRSEDAAKALRDAGVSMEMVISPDLAHGIDDVILLAAGAFLKKAFA